MSFVCAGMAAMRGRGSIGRGLHESKNALALRRPGGDAGMIQRFSFESNKTPTVSSQVTEICEKFLKFEVNSDAEVNPLVEKVESLCNSSNDVAQCVDAVFSFALKGKWNAHVTAILCNVIGDITANEAKFRTLLLRKLQTVYKERNIKYSDIDNFLMDVTFLCEIYHHVRIEGVCLKVLSRPVIDYFCMLVDGASQKEVEIFVDQFPKCYPSLKLDDESGLDNLINKLRKSIVCATDEIVRAMLLEIFEKTLTSFEILSSNAQQLYTSLSKPVERICK